MIVRLMFHENAVNAYDENAESILLLFPVLYFTYQILVLSRNMETKNYKTETKEKITKWKTKEKITKRKRKKNYKTAKMY